VNQRVSAARGRLCEILFQEILPPPDGSFLSRTFNFRKEINMDYNILVTVGIFGFFGVAIFAMVLKDWRHALNVPEGQVRLLYHKGKFVEVLAAGRHIRWGRHYTWNLLDVRKASLQVAGQEVLTADNVGLKMNLLVTYQIADPAKAAHETQNWQGDLYNASQLALRAVVGGIAVEALLTQRFEMGVQLLARVQPEAAKIGINVLAVEAKDVMFPADLKRAFADVLKAKQEGQAALERARGESASLRNLANAARVLEGNPALMNLRLMQSLTAAQNAGNTLVLGVPGGFVPLKHGKGNAAPEPAPEG
jgi:regulator of protease activity HflC (stomatin/prohibitin superfamily)